MPNLEFAAPRPEAQEFLVSNFRTAGKLFAPGLAVLGVAELLLRLLESFGLRTVFPIRTEKYEVK